MFIKKIISELLVSLTFFVLPFTVLQAENSGMNNLVLTEIIFEEIEPGLDPFTSRLLLGANFLRLDDGSDRGDFILFDRNSHEIHSFNHEDKLHLVMKSLSGLALDFKLDFKVEKKELLDAPDVQGVKPVQHHFYADGRLCKKSINVSGLLPELAQVLVDYEQTIVKQNNQTFSEIPASVRSSCYVANNYLHASDYLKVGFPLFVIDDQGRQKKLLDFQQIIKSHSIMEQPDDYSVYYPNASNLKDKD